MMGGIEASLSGMQAYGVRMQGTAHNVANLNTEGFKRTRVLMQESAVQGVQTLVEQDQSPGPLVVEQSGQGEELREQSNTDLTKEMPEMLENARGYSANLKALKTADEMLGRLLDVKA